ncbi:MAG TPA: hypothetical protein VI432_00440 [Candidatus Paceibacterota bacterium]
MNGEEKNQQEPGLADVPVSEPASAPQPPEPVLRPTPPPADFTRIPNEPVPPPPPSDISVRTMQEDVSSLSKSGGLGAEPKTFRPSDLLSKEEMFKPASSGGVEEPVLPPSPQKPKISHSLVVIIGSFIFLLIAGGVAYFFVLPLFNKEVAPPPPLPAPVEPPPPPVEPLPTPPPPPTLQHQSLFMEGAGVSSQEVVLDELNLANLGLKITASISGDDVRPGFKDLSFMTGEDEESRVLESVELWNVVAPGNQVSKLFEDDFTGFAYFDQNGIWPGYVFKLKTDPESMALREQIDEAIDVEDIAGSYIVSFYLNSPGAPIKSTFSDGLKVGEDTAKFVQFSLTGASFNMLQTGDYLILSTSFNGFKEALKNLGLQ